MDIQIFTKMNLLESGDCHTVTIQAVDIIMHAPVLFSIHANSFIIHESTQNIYKLEIKILHLLFSKMNLKKLEELNCVTLLKFYWTVTIQQYNNYA